MILDARYSSKSDKKRVKVCYSCNRIVLQSGEESASMVLPDALSKGEGNKRNCNDSAHTLSSKDVNVPSPTARVSTDTMVTAPDMDSQNIVHSRHVSSKKSLFSSRKINSSSVGSIDNSGNSTASRTSDAASRKGGKEDAYDFREDDSDFESPPFSSRLSSRRRSSANSEPSMSKSGVLGSDVATEETSKEQATTTMPSISTTTISSTTTILEDEPFADVKPSPVLTTSARGRRLERGRLKGLKDFRKHSSKDASVTGGKGSSLEYQKNVDANFWTL